MIPPFSFRAMPSPLSGTMTPFLHGLVHSNDGRPRGDKIDVRIPAHPAGLRKVLSPIQLWSIAVGLVISGEYFGWSYGWNTAGTIGFLIATVLVAAINTTFNFSFAELSTAIPHAAQPFAYARRAFGSNGRFHRGFATLIEFVFAPPAIALAIGA
jgi:ethanolamine permease